MSLNLISIFLTISYFNNVKSETGHCSYTFSDRFYQCQLYTEYLKPEITEIKGIHQNNFSDNDVEEIYEHFDQWIFTRDFPSVFCEKFLNLKNIHFYMAAYGVINEKSLEKCENLEKLDLSMNRIYDLPKNVFESQMKLKNLLISHNKIHNLRIGVFDYLINLEELDIDSNNLVNLHPKLFENLRNLKILNLDNNKIEQLPEGIFVNLTNLIELRLNSNKLKTLHFASFGDLLKLQKFYFNGNKLTSIDERIFKMKRMIDEFDNPCVDFSRVVKELNKAMKNCFENYQSENSSASIVQAVNN